LVKAISIGLAVALLVSIGLNVAVRQGSITRTPLEYFPDMARTVRYNAFEANPNFADGMTLRVPPPGTIPRGLLPLSSQPTTGPDGTPVNPIAPDDTAAAARGTVVFNTYCVPCHSATGEGDGLVVQHGFPAPPSLLRARTKAMDDAQIFMIITNGTGTMPSYAAQIAREDRWKAVVHLRQLQNGTASPAPGTPGTPAAPPPSGDAR
jgi:mono/diheme cytochrome c family protein